MHNNNPKAMLSPEARLSYPALFTPKPPYGRPNAPQEEWKYECTLLVPKTETAFMEDLKRTVELAVQEAVADNGPRGWNGLRPSQVSMPIQDGDTPKKSGEPRADSEKGMWIIKLKGKRKPQVRIATNIKGPDLTEAECYPGCWVRAVFYVGTYNTAGNKGVTFYLGNVLKCRDDESFSGSTSAESDFAGLEQAPDTSGLGMFG